MITFEYINDPIKEKEYLKRDNLYKNVLGIDDLTQWIKDPLDALILCKVNNKEYGIMLLKYYPNYLCFHGGIFKACRGKDSPHLLKKAIKKLKRLFYPLHIFTIVPETNRISLRLVKLAGMKYKRNIIHKEKNCQLFIE